MRSSKKRFIWSFTFCLSSPIANILTPVSRLLAPWVNFSQRMFCFLRNKNDYYEYSFVLFCPQNRIGFLSCRRFEDIPNPYYIPYPYKWNQPCWIWIDTWVLFFQSFLKHWTYSDILKEKPLSLKIQLLLFIYHYLVWNDQCQDCCCWLEWARCLSVILSSLQKCDW